MKVSSTYRPQNQTLPQGNLAATASYTFSAKERDVETGLSYFGARYYTSDLSIWLSVDPMSAKYPSLSPYVYCANNPVKLVDPNGEDWFENELTGDVYYARDYRKGDEQYIDGEGWKWMGENDMFGKSADEVIYSNYLNVEPEIYTGNESIDRAAYKGENAKKFMEMMGYKSVPTQVINFDDTYTLSVPATPTRNMNFLMGTSIDYIEKIGYVPSNTIEARRETLQCMYGNYNPLKNNTPSVSRMLIHYNESFISPLLSSFYKAMHGQHDYVNYFQTSVENINENNDLLDRFLIKYPR